MSWGLSVSLRLRLSIAALCASPFFVFPSWALSDRVYMECTPTQPSAVFAATPGMNCTQIPAHMIVRLDEVEARQKEIELARQKAEEARMQAERERLEAMHRQQIELERQKRKQELDAALAALKAKYAAIDAEILEINAATVPIEPPPQHSQHPVAPVAPVAASIKTPTAPIQQADIKPKDARKSFGPVKQGASLCSVISRYDELSNFNVDDVAATFVRINPSAFKTKNPSRLFSGATLTIPLPSDVTQTKAQSASVSAPPKATPSKKASTEDAEVVEKTIPNALAMPTPQVKVQDQPIPQENLVIEPLKKAAPVYDVPVQATSAPPQVQTASAPKSQSDARAQLLSEAQEIRRLIAEAKAAAKSGAAQ